MERTNSLWKRLDFFHRASFVHRKQNSSGCLAHCCYLASGISYKHGIYTYIYIGYIDIYIYISSFQPIGTGRLRFVHRRTNLLRPTIMWPWKATRSHHRTCRWPQPPPDGFEPSSASTGSKCQNIRLPLSWINNLCLISFVSTSRKCKPNSKVGFLCSILQRHDSVVCQKQHPHFHDGKRQVRSLAWPGPRLPHGLHLTPVAVHQLHRLEDRNQPPIGRNRGKQDTSWFCRKITLHQGQL